MSATISLRIKVSERAGKRLRIYRIFIALFRHVKRPAVFKLFQKSDITVPAVANRVRPHAFFSRITYQPAEGALRIPQEISVFSGIGVLYKPARYLDNSVLVFPGFFRTGFLAIPQDLNQDFIDPSVAAGGGASLPAAVFHDVAGIVILPF